MPKKYHKKTILQIDTFIFLSLYPKISAIASGATPIGSAGRAPDKKKSTKRLKLMIG
jgi:hypothetical protein